MVGGTRGEGWESMGGVFFGGTDGRGGPGQARTRGAPGRAPSETAGPGALSKAGVPNSASVPGGRPGVPSRPGNLNRQRHRPGAGPNPNQGALRAIRGGSFPAGAAKVDPQNDLARIVPGQPRRGKRGAFSTAPRREGVSDDQNGKKPVQAWGRRHPSTSAAEVLSFERARLRR